MDRKLSVILEIFYREKNKHLISESLDSDRTLLELDGDTLANALVLVAVLERFAQTVQFRCAVFSGKVSISNLKPSPSE